MRQNEDIGLANNGQASICKVTTPDKLLTERKQSGNRQIAQQAKTIGVLAGIAATALLSGCTTYRAEPLADPTASLTAPDAQALGQLTAGIDTPYLEGRPVDISQPLDRDGIALVALAMNPDLRASRQRAEVADAQLFDAGLLPDPGVGLNADRVFSGPPTARPGSFGGQILQDINALRTRGVRRDIAREAVRQVRLDLAWAEWMVVEAARIQAVRVAYLDQATQLAETSRAATQDLLDRTLRAAGRGDISSTEVETARLAFIDASDRANNLALSATEARVELRRIAGLPPSYPLRLARPERPATVPPMSVLEEHALANRFDLEALRAGYASQEALVRKAVLDQFPTLNLGVSLSRDNSNNGIVGALLDFTLPVFNRNRGQIAIERATREALRAEYDARLFSVRADLASLWQAIAELDRQRVLLATELPALQRYAAATRRAAERGDLALSTAIAAEQTARDRELLILGIDQALAEQTIALELASLFPKEHWTQ